MPHDDIAIRTEFCNRLSIIVGTRAKLVGVTGRGRTFNFAEGFKIHEGFLLSAWTAWESMIRDLFMYDLATDSAGILRSDVKAHGFRLKGSPHRLAEYIVAHPDERRFIDWNNIDDVKNRADALLGSGHRYRQASSHEQTLGQIRKARNAVAHKSDQAWKKFRSMVRNTPYALTTGQMRGITVGRFLASHRVNTKFVLEHFLDELSSAANALVP